MSKIHVKQIALVRDGDGDIYSEYLDNMGRVWFQAEHFEDRTIPVADGVERTRERVTEWQQLELPEEPQTNN